MKLRKVLKRSESKVMVEPQLGYNVTHYEMLWVSESALQNSYTHPTLNSQFRDLILTDEVIEVTTVEAKTKVEFDKTYKI